MTDKSSAAAADGRGSPSTVAPQAIALLGGLTLFWGINFPMIKLAVSVIDPWTFRVICLGVGGFGLLAIAKAKGGSLRIPRGEFGPLVLCCLLNITCWHLCSAFALTLIEAGRAVIIAYTMPVWASVLSVVILGERFSWRRGAGLALGVAGLAILLVPDADAILANPWGPVLMLGAAVGWGSGTVALKAFRWTLPVVQLTGYQLLAGGVPVLIGMVLVGRPDTLAAAGTQQWIGLVYAATIPMIFCHYAWFKTVTLLPANIAAIGTLAIPVVGVLSSTIALGEPVGPAEIASLAMVVAALALVLVRPQTR